MGERSGGQLTDSVNSTLSFDFSKNCSWLVTHPFLFFSALLTPCGHCNRLISALVCVCVWRCRPSAVFSAAAAAGDQEWTMNCAPSHINCVSDRLFSSWVWIKEKMRKDDQKEEANFVSAAVREHSSLQILSRFLLLPLVKRRLSFLLKLTDWLFWCKGKRRRRTRVHANCRFIINSKVLTEKKLKKSFNGLRLNGGRRIGMRWPVVFNEKRMRERSMKTYRRTIWG